jgi:type II secretory pathway pseudopilin PulG
VFLALVACLLVSLEARSAEAEAALARSFPAETVIYVGLEDLVAFRGQVPGTALGRIWADEKMQAFVEKPQGQIEQYLRVADAMLKAHSPLELSDLGLLFGRRVGVGIVWERDEEQSAAAGVEQPSVLLVADFDDEDQASTCLAKILATLKRHSPPHLLEKADLEGTGPVRIPTANGGQVVLATVGSQLRAAVGAETSDALARQAGAKPESALSETKAWVDAQRTFKETPFLRLHVNLKQGIENLRAVRKAVRELGAPAQPEGAAQEAPERRLETMLAGAAEGWTVGLSTEGTAFVTESFLAVPSEGSFLSGMMGRVPVSEAILKTIPRQTSYLSAGQVSFDSLVEVLRVLTAHERGEHAFESVVESLSAELGTNPLEILNALGEEAAFVSLDSDTVAGVPLFGLSSAGLIVRVEDPDAVRQGLSLLTHRAARELAGSEVGGGLLQQRYEGVRIKGARVVFGGVFAPAYAVTDGFLVVGSGVPVVERILDTMAGRSPNILANEEYRQVREWLGVEDPQFVSFAARPEVSLNPYSGGGMTTLPVFAGMMLPALQRARASAKRVKSVNNLKQIGMAMATHRTDTGGYPDSLGELLAEVGITDASTLVCPATSTPYRYAGGGLLDAALEQNANPSEIMAAWTAAPIEHGGQSHRIVAFLDGSAREVPRPEFEEHLQEMKSLAGDAGLAFNPTGADVPIPAGGGGGPFGLGGFSFEEGAGRAVKTILKAVPFYRLPPADLFNRHLFPSGSVSEVLPEGIRTRTRSPLPFVMASPGGGGAGTTQMALIAAIAIPNLLESKKQAVMAAEAEGPAEMTDTPTQ